MNHESSITDNRPPISPQDYSRILNGLKLTRLSLIDCQSRVDSDAAVAYLAKQNSLPLNIGEKASFSLDDGTVLVSHAYTITSQNRRKMLMYIKAEYHLRFQSTEEFTDDFFLVFKRLALPMFTWPYLRELADSFTSRMDMPRLLLPIRK